MLNLLLPIWGYIGVVGCAIFGEQQKFPEGLLQSMEMGICNPLSDALVLAKGYLGQKWPRKKIKLLLPPGPISDKK